MNQAEAVPIDVFVVADLVGAALNHAPWNRA